MEEQKLSWAEKEIADAKARLAAVKEHMLRWGAIGNAISEDTKDLVASIKIYGTSMYILLSGTREDLGVMWRSIRAQGFEPVYPDNTDEEKKSEYRFKFSRGSIESNMQINLNYSSTVCRVVQVGTKTETVPAYEIRCD